MFTSSSSSSPRPNTQNQNLFPNYSTPSNKNTFSNLNARLAETMYFGNIKITSPSSLNFRFKEVNENLSSESKVLIHNIFSYKQYFAKANVIGVFFYSIFAFNMWFDHFEQTKKFYEEKSNSSEKSLETQTETIAENLLSTFAPQTIPIQQENTLLKGEKNDSSLWEKYTP